MKITRFLVVVALVLVFSGATFADTVDPAIGVKGGGGSTGLFSLNDPNFAFTVIGNSFSVGSVQNFDFINASGQTALEVDLVATLLQGTPALTYTCFPTSVYFTNCSVTPLSGGQQTLIRYFNPNFGEGGLGGIPNDPNPTCDGVHSCSPSNPSADFAVFVQDVAGDLANLGPNQGFSVQGTLSVPEPASLILFGTGIGVLGLTRRRRNQKTTS